MKVTVAICTHNRAKDTGEAVLSVLRQDFDKKDMEIVVVDNRSSDDTASVVEGLRRVHGDRVRYAYEEKLGLSVARNRAIREARGEYVLFLDDDAIASSRWVRHIVDVFERDAAIGCVGGKIDPIWEAGEPDWIPDEYRAVFTILDYTEGVKEMPAPAIPYGANVAFRRSVFDEFAPFREDLGRIGSNLLSSEESELIGRIRSAHKVYYSSYALVWHKIPKERTTKAWFRKRIFWQGVSDAVRMQDKGAIPVAKHTIRMLQAAAMSPFVIFRSKSFFRQVFKAVYRNGSLVGTLRYSGRS
ncbi:glycosyltransferase [Cohnella sp. GCM10027633]|uniref:glycosyltransferase n=1 Tax=unclassified Cohnella TaxID=2636738 RepID=UPI003640CC3A